MSFSFFRCSSGVWLSPRCEAQVMSIFGERVEMTCSACAIAMVAEYSASVLSVVSNGICHENKLCGLLEISVGGSVIPIAVAARCECGFRPASATVCRVTPFLFKVSFSRNTWSRSKSLGLILA